MRKFLETIISYPFLKEMFKTIWIARWKWDVLFSPPFHSQSETYGMLYLQATKTNQTGNSVLERIYSSCGSRVELCAQTSKPITFSPESSRLIAASVPSVIASSLSRVVRAGRISPLDVHYSLVFFYFLEICCFYLIISSCSISCVPGGFSDEVPYHFPWLNWFASLQVLCSLGCLSPRIGAINRAVEWRCLIPLPGHPFISNRIKRCWKFLNRLLDPLKVSYSTVGELSLLLIMVEYNEGGTSLVLVTFFIEVSISILNVLTNFQSVLLLQYLP